LLVVIIAAVADDHLQIICITMMALALAEDSISKRERRDLIIDELGKLPEKMKTFMKVCVGLEQST
jgi:nucleoside-triphosphatase THEP1